MSRCYKKNHDRPENVSYKPFNMNGARYDTYARKNVRFFVLDTTQMDAKQVAWIDEALQVSERGLEDLLLQSSSVLERDSSWFGAAERKPEHASEFALR
ncbi:MAG: hypothetical protein ABW318_05365 [Vicinamibacterales bacterium]|jgi:hypothetical protein